MTRGQLFSRTLGRAVLLVLTGCGACVQTEQASPAAQKARVRIVDAPTRVVQIPVRLLTESNGDQPPNGQLTIRPAQTDQRAEGPPSFDVLEDGTIAVADPLANRIAMYTAHGTFKKALDVDAPVEEVKALGSGRLRVTEAIQDARRVIDLDGRRVSTDSLAVPEAILPQAALTSERSGVLRWSRPASDRAGAAFEVRVELSAPNRRLASLRPLAVDRQSLYVSVASADTTGGSPDSVDVIVRRYSLAGVLDLEVRNISTNYDVAPETLFRVSGGMLYQLFPTMQMVRIYVWDVR